MNTTTNDHCIEVCNSLLRGELSAVETYSQAIEKFASESEAAKLVEIRKDHEASAADLRENVTSMGGTPSTESGTWGSFAQGVQGAANLFGENSALQSLKQGEKHGHDEYTDALEDNDVMASCKDLIRNTLLPRTNRHIGALDELAASNR